MLLLRSSDLSDYYLSFEGKLKETNNSRFCRLTSRTVQVFGTTSPSFSKLAVERRPTLVRSLNNKKALVLNPPHMLGREGAEGENSLTWSVAPSRASNDNGLVPVTRTVISILLASFAFPPILFKLIEPSNVRWLSIVNHSRSSFSYVLTCK